MKGITLMVAAAALAGSSTGAQAQEIRYSTSPSVVVASGFGGTAGKLGLSVGSGSARDTLGLLVLSIVPDGPAEQAGIIEGDRITAVNGTPLTLSPADAGEPDMSIILRRRLERELAKVDAGEEVTLRVSSAGRSREVKVRASEERRRTMTPSVSGSYTVTRAGSENRPVIGVSLGATGSQRDTLGVFVMGVEPGGPAERAGIIEGHRIAAINGVDLRIPAVDAGDAMVASTRASRLSREIEKLEPGARVQLRVWSDGRFRDVTVEVGRRGDVYKNDGVVRIGTGTAVLSPNVILRTVPGGSVFRFGPDQGRVESLDSLWQKRDEIRRSVDPRFRPDTSDQQLDLQFDARIRDLLERARIEVQRVQPTIRAGVIRTSEQA